MVFVAEEGLRGSRPVYAYLSKLRFVRQLQTCSDVGP